MKFSLDEEAYNALSDDMKGEYKKNEDGGFVLNIEGAPEVEDLGALKRAKVRESEGRKKAEAELAKLRSEQEKLTDDQLRKAGDIKTLDESYAAKFAEMEASNKAVTSKLVARIEKDALNSAAKRIADDISTAPGVLLPHLIARMTVEMSEDFNPKVRFLDKEGKVSALSDAEFAKEFVANKDFAAIIKASQASGGASEPAPGGRITKEEFDPTKATPAELVAYIKAKKGKK